MELKRNSIYVRFVCSLWKPCCHHQQVYWRNFAFNERYNSAFLVVALENLIGRGLIETLHAAAVLLLMEWVGVVRGIHRRMAERNIDFRNDLGNSCRLTTIAGWMDDWSDKRLIFHLEWKCWVISMINNFIVRILLVH